MIKAFLSEQDLTFIHPLADAERKEGSATFLEEFNSTCSVVLNVVLRWLAFRPTVRWHVGLLT